MNTISKWTMALALREFLFRYKFKRRTGVLSLGKFPGLSLADARARAQ
jgi:hypothetical protein